MAAQKKQRPKSNQTTEDYSQVFEKLVDSAGDGHNHRLIGLFAYSLYKAAKREWIIEYQEKNGKRPSQKERLAHAESQTEVILDGYRSQASEILAEYANAVVKDATPNIQNKALQGTFLRAFWPSLAASLTFAALIALLVFIAAFSGFTLPVEISDLSKGS